MLRLRSARSSIAPAPSAVGVTRTSAAAPPAAPPRQIVRDFRHPQLELLRLLHEAAAIEHAVLVQYVYAACSIKPAYQGLVGEARAGSTGLLGVAIQEMQHLHWVNQTIVAAGGSPNLTREEFPFQPGIWPFAFHREPLSAASLAKYVFAEAPAAAIDPAHPATEGDVAFLDRLYTKLPREGEENQLGSLYHTVITIAEQFARLPGGGFRDASYWIRRLRHIMDEGEEEHFAFFKGVFLGRHEAFRGQDQNPWDLPPDSPWYPAFALPVDPSAYQGHSRVIEPEALRCLAWLSDLHYWITLLLLDLSYWDEERTAMYMARAQAHMREQLWRLATTLAEHGAGPPFDPLGPGYGLGRDPAQRLRILQHMLDEARHWTKETAARLPSGYPLDVIDETLATSLSA
jgi:hypothetical protein